MKIGFRILAVLVACVIFFNVATVPARASATAVAVWVAATAVVASILYALGVQTGTLTNDWLQSVVDCEAFLSGLGYVSDGLMQMVQISSGSYVKGYVPMDTIEAIRSWLFDTEVITETPYVSLGTGTKSCTLWGSSYTVKNDRYPLGLVLGVAKQSSGYAYHLLVISQKGYSVQYSPNNYNNTYTDQQGPYFNYKGLSSGSLAGSFPPSSGVTVYDFGTTDENLLNLLINTNVFVGGVDSDLDLTLDEVAGSALTVDTGYPAWAENSVTVPGSTSVSGEDEQYYPLTVPGSVEDVQSMTKEEAQAGDVAAEDVVDPDAIPDTADGIVTSTWLGKWLSRIASNVRSIVESVLDVISEMDSIPGKIADVFSGWFEAIVGFVSTFPDVLSNLLDIVVTNVLDGIASIFVPTEDYVSIKVAELCEYFPFITSVIDTVNYIEDNLSADGPPVIYVDLGAAGGDVNWGGKTVLVDFAFYEEYKPTVDTILSACMFSFFAWRVFIHLPGIIGGDAGSIVGNAVRSSGKSKSDEGE